MTRQIRPGGPQQSGDPGVDQITPPGGVTEESSSEVSVGSELVDTHVDGFATEIGFYGKAVERLPEDLYVIERATWFTRAISPLRSRDLEGSDSRYEISAGAVDGYLQDKDGLRNLRKWRVPATSFTPYEFDALSDDGFGILRDLDGIVDDLQVNAGEENGDIVSVDGVEVFKDFGILGPIFSDAFAVRIEYRRRGELVCCTHEDFAPNFDASTPEEEVDTDTGLFSGIVPLSFLATEIFDDEIDTDYNNSNELWIDTTKYPNRTKVVFQATLDSSFSTTSKTILLKDDGGNTIGTVTVGDGVDPTLARDEAVTLLEGNRRYSFFVQTAEVGDEAGLVFEDVQVLIYQTNAARTRIQIPLLCSHNQSSGGFAGTEQLNNYYAYCQTYGGDAYGYGPFTNPPGTQGTEDFYHYIWKYEADKWSTITNVDFETIGYFRHGSPEGTPCACGASGLASLFDFTATSQIAATEHIFDSDDDVFPTRKLASFDISALTDTHEFHLKAHQDRNLEPDPCELRLSRAALYLDLDCSLSQKAQVYHRVMSDRGTSASTRDEIRYLHEPSEYPAGTKFYVEATGRHNATTGTLNLVDGGTTDVGTGSDVTGSTLTFDTTYSRQRSAELTLTDGNRYISKIAGNLGTRHTNMFVLAEIPDA